MIPIPRTALEANRYALQPDAVVTNDEVVAGSPVLVVDDGRIAYCGPRPTAIERYPNLAVTRLEGAVIVPGFIDTHHHVSVPYAKALTFGEPAQLWSRLWLPIAAILDPELSYYGAKWTFIEALRGGFTTVVDSAIRPEDQTLAVLRAAEECGIRLVSSTGVFDLQDFEAQTPTPNMSGSVEEALAVAEAHLSRCANYENVIASMACGTVQSNSGDVIGALAEWCADRGVLFQIHANEHTAEVHRMIERRGLRPIEYLDQLGALGPTTLLAHAALVTPAELIRISETDTAVSYNPVASQWKGNGVAPALMFHELGIRFGLGTDNTRNDAFRLLDAAEATQRIAFGMGVDDFSSGGGGLWWRAATLGGAAAAGLDAEVGELREGMQADYLVLDATGPERLPSWDLTWELVRFYDRSCIAAVVVAGKPRVIDGLPVNWDLDAFMADALPRGIASIQRAKLVRRHRPSSRGLSSPGEPTGA